MTSHPLCTHSTTHTKKACDPPGADRQSIKPPLVLNKSCLCSLRILWVARWCRGAVCAADCTSPQVSWASVFEVPLWLGPLLLCLLLSLVCPGQAGAAEQSTSYGYAPRSRDREIKTSSSDLPIKPAHSSKLLAEQSMSYGHS